MVERWERRREYDSVSLQHTQRNTRNQFLREINSSVCCDFDQILGVINGEDSLIKAKASEVEGEQFLKEAKEGAEEIHTIVTLIKGSKLC